MATKKYILAKPDGTFDRDNAFAIDPLRKAIHRKVSNRPAVEWRIGIKPKEQGKADLLWRPDIISKVNAISQILNLCKRKGNLGDLYVMEHVPSGYQVRVRPAEVPSIFDYLKGCSKRLKRHHRHIATTHKDQHSLGRAACRSIGSSSTPSQHAGKPTNAEDWTASFNEMKQAVEAEVKIAKGGNPYRLRNVIFDNKIYNAANRWNGAAYGGSCPHRTHWHVDYDPPATRFCT